MNNFWENDDFSLVSMTETINDIIVPPARIGSLGLFPSQGITTTTVGVEKQGNTLKLIPTQARGSMPEYKRDNQRTMLAIPVPHLPKNDALVADGIQNLRSFGSESALDAFASVLANKLAVLKAEHELTWEYHRIGALQGKVLDADGTSVVYNLFTIFDVTETTVTWDTTDVTDLRAGVALGLEDAMAEALIGTTYTGIHVFCGENFWNELITSTEVSDAFKQYQSNKFFTGEQTSAPFVFAGITWERLRGKVGAIPFIDDDEARAIPLGTTGLFQQYNAPGTFEETVNTLGLPYYARQEPMKFGVGREIHTQSNPLFICRKPKALIKLVFTT